jgi:prevent-host-death family protein
MVRKPNNLWPEVKSTQESIAMTTVDIRDISPELAALLRRALDGEDVVIVEDNLPVARLIALSSGKSPHIAGLHRDVAWISDDFDAPLDETFWTGEQ